MSPLKLFQIKNQKTLLHPQWFHFSYALQRSHNLQARMQKVHLKLSWVETMDFYVPTESTQDQRKDEYHQKNNFEHCECFIGDLFYLLK